jgi:hypothetical protein
MILPLRSIQKNSRLDLGEIVRSGATIAVASELPVAPSSITVAIPREERP